MTSEEEGNFGIPSSGSNPVTCGTSTTNGTNFGRKRRLTSIDRNDCEKVTIDGQDSMTSEPCHSKFKVDGENGSKVRIGRFIFDEDVCRKNLVHAIILHNYPLSIVDHKGFKEFSNYLQPLFKMVSRNTIKNDIMKIYAIEKEKMSNYLEKLESRIAITTDMWTSDQNKSYMAITIHYIDENWLLQHRIVSFVHVPPPHTKQVLSNFLLDALLDWNIDRKISTITMDNCSSNDGMIDILLEKLSSIGSLLLHGKIFHMRCATHILSLIVKEGLNVIKVEVEKVRENVMYWLATPLRMKNFEEVVCQFHLSYDKKLSLDCETQWSSTYLMLSTTMNYKDVFLHLKQHEKLDMEVPSEEEWKLIKEICEKLKLFYDISKFFSGHSYPTTNTFFIQMCEIKEALCNWLLSSNATISMMISKMIEIFDKYWSGCTVGMAIVVILDPRYKMKLLEFCFPIIYGLEASNEVKNIREKCYDLFSEYQSMSQTNEDTSLYGASSSSMFANYDKKDPLSKFDLFVRSSIEESNMTLELDRYLEEPVLPRIANFDVLNWWKTNGIKYPILKRIVRDIYAIPVSTVALESTLSTSGRMVSKHRSKLHPNTLEALMCVQSWLGDKMKGTDLMDIEEDDEL